MHSSNPIRLAVIAEDFSLTSPAQQLADRFLFGLPAHPDQGEPPVPATVTLHVAPEKASNEALESRVKMGLKVCPTLAQAVDGADAVVIAGRKETLGPASNLIEAVLAGVRVGAPCFVHGMLGETRDAASELMAAAARRNIPLLAGTATATAWRLPVVDVPQGAAVDEALIIVQGESRRAFATGVEGLQPFLERRRGGESGVSRVHLHQGEPVWKTGLLEGRTGQLLAAALSRSDSPQGNSVADGRTQDLYVKGLVPKLAREPRLWVLEHRDGLISRVAALDGVINDTVLAVYAGGSRIVSTQLYRPPPPAEALHDRLVEAVRQFIGGKSPWPPSRGMRLAEILELAAKAGVSA